MYRAWIEIDTGALRQNALALKSLLPDKTAIMAMVKANAYGHGIKATVPAIERFIDWFGVDSPQEAEEVRRLTEKPILITGGVLPNQVEHIVREGFHQMVSDPWALSALSRAAARTDQIAHVHLKVDTGMSRQGATQDDLLSFLLTARHLYNVHIAGIATHFANADEPNDKTTEEQIAWLNNVRKFTDELGIRQYLTHSANSAATITRPDSRFDLVRTGIALYGIWPSKAVQRAAPLGWTITPALSFKTRVVQLKTVLKGSGVGYGHTETLQRDTRIAVLPVGYADGYDRKLSRIGEVALNGSRARVLGNVSMNITTIDVTDIPDAHVGSVVELIGRNVSAAEVATKVETIPYEIVARLRESLPRVST